MLKVGDMVFKAVSSSNRAGVVTEMRMNEGRLPEVWIDFGNGLPMPEQPELLEVF